MLKPGDVVIAIFAYSDLTGTKTRPALVVSTESFNQETRLTVLAMISSKQVRNRYEANIAEWRNAGLRFPSKVCLGKLITINANLVKPIGRLSENDLGVLSKINKVIA